MAICENCNQEHNGTYGSGRFCSSKCARGFSTKAKRKEINEKVSTKINANKFTLIDYCICKWCGKNFITRINSGHYTNKQHTKQQYCSIQCSNKNRASVGGRKISQKKLDSLAVRRSKNEIYFAELCKQKFRFVFTNLPLFNGWDADVIIEDLKLAILWNGIWHYKQTKVKNHSLKRVQFRDILKKNLIKQNGYKILEIKDMGGFDKNFVECQFNYHLND